MGEGASWVQTLWSQIRLGIVPGSQNMTAGPPGPQGDQGIQGVSGTPGYTPQFGIDYFNGSQGIQGIQGEQGIPGLDNMTAGPQGEQGQQGYPGYTPIFGVDYFNGSQGIQGLMNQTSNLTANMTAGPVGSMNLTANMTAGPVGAMNQTANQTAGAKGDKGDPGTTDHGLLTNKTEDGHLQYILVSGLRAFTGKQSMGGYNLTTLLDPVAAQDATTKAYEDARAVINSSYVPTTLLTAVNDSMRNNVSLNFIPMVSNKTPTINLGNGSASATTFLRGDQSWQVPAGGSSSSVYTIAVQALTSSPADNVVVYFGMNPVAPSTTAGQSKIYIRKTGYIVGAEIYTYSTTAGTAQPWNLSVYKNGATGYLIQDLSLATSERIFTNWSLNLPVAAGDYVQIRSRQPGWSTNPLATTYGGYLYLNVT